MEHNITLECEAVYCKMVVKQFQTISIVFYSNQYIRSGKFLRSKKISHILQFDPIHERLFVAELARYVPSLRVADRGKGNS